MRHYYKVIYTDSNSFFSVENQLGDPCDIYPGQRFTARGEKYTWCMKYTDCDFYPKVCILSEMPTIHFCDNALDAVLWHRLVMGPNISAPGYAYEVRPLSSVIKEQSCDRYGLFQCGANKIEIVHPIPMAELERAAIHEFDTNPHNAIFRYPDINVLKVITDLRQYGK